MTDYTELVKALRHCVSDEKGVTKCAGCPYYLDMTGCMDRLHTDAAAAIEELQARLGEAENSVERWKDMYLTKHEPKRGEMRCRECKWYQEGYDIDGKWFSRCNGSVRTYGQTTPDWYCADGEREVQE